MSKYLVDIDGQKLTYSIKDDISFEDATGAYQRIVEAAFHDTEDEYRVIKTVYTPYLVGLARDYAIMALFTDLDLADQENEYIWKLAKFTDVLANIAADDRRSDIIRVIDDWAYEYIEDYKTRILANAARDELLSALREAVAPTESEFDMNSLRGIADKINNMSEEDMLKAIIAAGKNAD